MSKPSPISRTLHESFASELMPLLRGLDLAIAKPRNVKPGLVAALAARPLLGGRRLEVCLWCDAATGGNLRLRVDIIADVGGVESSTQVALNVPWRDESPPAPMSLDFSGKEFLPHQGDEQLRKAIAFLAGAFAGSADQLAAALPELGIDLARVAREPSWNAAAKHAAELWSTRHVRGEMDDTRVAASIVFVGTGLVTVSAQGERHTFRFDTRDFDRAAAVSVSGFFLTPAATRRATRLTAGETTWHFDPNGTLTRVTR